MDPASTDRSLVRFDYPVAFTRFIAAGLHSKQQAAHPHVPEVGGVYPVVSPAKAGPSIRYLLNTWLCPQAKHFRYGPQRPSRSLPASPSWVYISRFSLTSSDVGAGWRRFSAIALMASSPRG